VDDPRSQLSPDTEVELGGLSISVPSGESRTYDFSYTLPIGASSAESYSVIAATDYTSSHKKDGTMAPFRVDAFYSLSIELPARLQACSEGTDCSFQARVRALNNTSSEIADLDVNFDLPFGVQTANGAKRVTFHEGRLAPNAEWATTVSLVVVEPNEAADFVVTATTENGGATREAKTMAIDAVAEATMAGGAALPIQGPHFVSVPPDATIATCSEQPFIGWAQAVDGWGNYAPATYDAPTTFPLGDTIVTWRVSDSYGRQAEYRQRVTNSAHCGMPCLPYAVSAQFEGSVGCVTINSATMVDSYSHAQGAYGGGNPPNRGAQGNIAMSASQFNNSCPDNCSAGCISGHIDYSVTPVFSGSSLPVPTYVANGTQLWVSGDTTLTRPSPGQPAYYDSLGLNSGVLTLEAGDYVIKNLYLNAGMLMIEGAVRLWVLNAPALNAAVEVRSNNPGDFWLIYNGSSTVNQNSNSNVAGVIFAPAAQVNINGKVNGAIVAGNIVLNSNASVHYDTDLGCSSTP
jgi:hypothetical protein